MSKYTVEIVRHSELQAPVEKRNFGEISLARAFCLENRNMGSVFIKNNVSDRYVEQWNSEDRIVYFCDFGEKYFSSLELEDECCFDVIISEGETYRFCILNSILEIIMDALWAHYKVIGKKPDGILELYTNNWTKLDSFKSLRVIEYYKKQIEDVPDELLLEENECFRDTIVECKNKLVAFFDIAVNKNLPIEMIP